MDKAKFLVKLDDSSYNKPVVISKSGVSQVAEKMYNDVLEGNTSAIATAELFKFIEEIGKEVKSKTDINGKNSFTELVRGEIQANANGEKKCTSKYGTTLELAETGTKYVFEKCGDPLWTYYETQINGLKKKQEKREKFLKTVEAAFPVGNVLIPETGEIYENVELFPPIKTSNSSYKQSLVDA